MQDNLGYIDYEQLTIRYLNGDIDASERELLLQWLKDSSNNVQVFNNVRAILEAVKQPAETPQFDVNAAIASFDKHVESKSKVISKKSNKISWVTISSVAAAIVLFVGVFISVFSKSEELVIAQAGNQAKEVVLTDGTFAILSPNSKLTADDSFGSKHRKLHLKGEAYFEVKHDDKHPFSIEVNNVNITDIGTEFKVTSDSLTGDVTVKVSEGIVQVDYANVEKILKAGNYITILGKSKKITSGNFDLNQPLRQQIENALMFENTSLDVVLNKLNAKFNKQFVLESPELASQRLNANFDDNISIEEVEELLKVVLGVQIIEENNQLKIYKANN